MNGASWLSRVLILLCSLMWYVPGASALTDRSDPVSAGPGVTGSVSADFHHAAFDVIPSVTQYAMGARMPSAVPGLQQFFRDHTRDWEVGWDERGDRPHLVQGVGIALLPGKGNTLKMADLGLAAGQQPDLSTVERLLRQFIDTHMGLFRVTQGALRLHRDSTAFGSDARLWLIDFEVFHQGVPVRGAKVFFRINHGNIVQFGTELVGEVHLDMQPRVSSSEAVALVLQHAGVEPSAVARVLREGALMLYPELVAGEAPGERYRGVAGAGYAHRLVREVDFRLVGGRETYRGVVDAHTGAVLEFFDLNKYAAALVSGGIYPHTNTDPEEIRPLARMTVSNPGNKATNEAGLYDYFGGLASARLGGQLASANDTCGNSGLSNSTDGNLNFGSSGGTDCTTPGFGGAGNTHASRTSLYHTTSVKLTARFFLRTNPWVASTLRVNTNIVDTCNAFWDGTTLNFFRSGDGCSNTGEIAAIMYHEFGHGLDQNTGGAASEGGSGEAVGDITAFLETRDSCIGPNFQPGVPCHNCGSTGCTGVRDMEPFANGGAATIARPSTVTSETGIGCNRFACPSACGGPMGYECHCESHIASTAVWDLSQSLVAAHGAAAGWATMKELWYASLFPTKSAYQVVSGGQCNPSATVNGCGASNWYTVLLMVDDNDGNLANGTPNGCRIWQAFNDHGIACGTQPPCSP